MKPNKKCDKNRFERLLQRTNEKHVYIRSGGQMVVLMYIGEGECWIWSSRWRLIIMRGYHILFVTVSTLWGADCETIHHYFTIDFFTHITKISLSIPHLTQFTLNTIYNNI